MDSGKFVFLNDDLVPISLAKVSVTDRGLLYGDGFFETILVEYGYPLFLQEHIRRLCETCSRFNIHVNPELESWSKKIRHLLNKNELSSRLAVLKILVTRGDSFTDIALPHSDKPTVVIYARPYSPYSKEKYQKGLIASVYPNKRHFFIADHKSLNYLFYLAARQWTKGQGSDEAIILNADGSVSEGATTNIFYVKQDVVFKPKSAHYLRGIMEQQVIRFLKKGGIRVVERKTSVKDLLESDEVFLTNSLAKVIPVHSINGKVLPRRHKISAVLMGKDWKV